MTYSLGAVVVVVWPDAAGVVEDGVDAAGAVIALGAGMCTQLLLVDLVAQALGDALRLLAASFPPDQLRLDAAGVVTGCRAAGENERGDTAHNSCDQPTPTHAPPSVRGEGGDYPNVVMRSSGGALRIARP